MLPIPDTNERLKAFVYGFLSVFTFGLIPSYLMRAELPKVGTFDRISIATGGEGLLQDFHNVACDVRRAANKISDSKV